MVLKRRKYTPQEYLQVGMAFFMVGIFASQMADGKMIGAFFAHLFQDKPLLDAIQGASAGFSIPILCVSIFFNVRGLYLLRLR
jgi:hypothetical protein